jgi:hypothetical protein
MPRFVVLEHDRPYLHWDLMLEAGDALLTWRLASPPQGEETIAATFLAEHRRMYLDYEGPVSKGRGMVTRWDSGTFAWEERREDLVAVSLSGMRACGQLTLRRVNGEEWTFKLSREPQTES